jgi:hypothetical protein
MQLKAIRILEKATDITSTIFAIMFVISAVRSIMQNNNPLIDMVVCAMAIIVLRYFRQKYMDVSM